MKRKHTHIGCYGIITNNNKIALIKKARGGYLGKLDLPGGGIGHDESPEDTLKRELMEEVGGIIKDYKLLSVKDSNIVWRVKDNFYEDLHHIGIIYMVNIKNDIRKTPDGIDSNGADWYDINTLNMNNLTPFAKYAITYLKNNK